jgi:hypothetical protein
VKVNQRAYVYKQKEPDMKNKANPPEQKEEQASTDGKKKWQEPKLGFIKPKLTKHGKLEEVTGQFFGAFTPPPKPN